MRNKYPGECYNCGKIVEVGDGFFEKIKGTKRDWRVKHASCGRAKREGLDKTTKKS